VLFLSFFLARTALFFAIGHSDLLVKIIESQSMEPQVFLCPGKGQDRRADLWSNYIIAYELWYY
jgi:hypothetical protein